MSVLNFPKNPTVGLTYELNGLYYEYDGTKWSSISIVDNLDVKSLNQGPLAGFRNQIINGDFRIWQRGT